MVALIAYNCFQCVAIGSCLIIVYIVVNSILHHCFALLCTCRAKDSQAASASAWRLVQLQQHYSVTISLPLSLPVSDDDDADTKATALTQGTTALEAALSAGLISSGQSPPHLRPLLACGALSSMSMQSLWILALPSVLLFAYQLCLAGAVVVPLMYCAVSKDAVRSWTRSVM